MLRPTITLRAALLLGLVVLLSASASTTGRSASLPSLPRTPFAALSLRAQGVEQGPLSPIFLPLVRSNAMALPAPALAAFPGAEGFGASTTGGRGGRVIYVTTLDPDGPGSFQDALNTMGPRYILFKVSGVIPAAANIVHGDVTIAGQTSPGGITVRGLVCDGHYERNDCDNLVVRHLRSRPAFHLPNEGNHYLLDDALRLDGLQNFVIDHSSFANAADEAAQISWARNGTIQNSIFAETVGEHADLGGMLINYSHSSHPQDNLSIHHNMWHRIGGRLPEISCERSGYGDGEPELPSDCAAHPLNIELSNNLLWDPGFPITYGDNVREGDPEAGTFTLNLNWVNNYMRARGDFSHGMFLDAVITQPGNQLYFSGNQMNLYPQYADYQLVYCCNDFPAGAPNMDKGVATNRTTPHPFPPISYTTTNAVVPYMINTVGAFPRDPMDRRYISALRTDTVDARPRNVAGADDAFALNFDPANPPQPPEDTDIDGMPDGWEQAHGLNPLVQDQNGGELSLALTGVTGYTNLECYLNELSDRIVAGE